MMILCVCSSHFPLPLRTATVYIVVCTLCSFKKKTKKHYFSQIITTTTNRAPCTYLYIFEKIQKKNN